MNPARRPPKRAPLASALLALLLLVPTLLGGCPEFRNGVVDAVDTATRGVLLGGVQPQDALDTAVRGVFSAALDWLFGSLKTDETRRF